MKTWHVMAATAWVAAFLWLARTAAGLLDVSHDRATAWHGAGFATAVDAMYFLILWIEVMAWSVTCRRAGVHPLDVGWAVYVLPVGLVLALAAAVATIWLFHRSSAG
jgi:hypothetical protein